MLQSIKNLFGQRPSGDPKIVGLMPARNEESKIEFALKALSQHTDAIIYLDDCSTDSTVARVEAIRETCNIERILTKDKWFRDEPGDRNRLLEAGRAVGGTHFIVIDADEAITSNSLDNDILRERILALKPGDQLALHWIQLWRDIHHYRTDGDRWANKYKRCIFCDNGKAQYSSEFIHTSRIPKMKGKRTDFKGPYGLLHFQFSNWDNLMLKQQWYCWLERVRTPEKPVADIRNRYLKSIDESTLERANCPPEWFSGYPTIDPGVFNEPDNWRTEQMQEWIEEHGSAFFDGLELSD